jgi:esterase/lipase superfamily enzyme
VRTIWGDVPRLGDVNPQQEPYRTELADDRITVYDLTHLANLGRVLINPIL